MQYYVKEVGHIFLSVKSPVFNSNQGISERYWYYYRGPIICGGNQLGEVSNDCYALYNDAVNSTSDQYQIDWWPTLSMLEPRIHAASVQILEAGLTSQYNWWVSGGQDKNLDILKSTEIRWSNGTWAKGRDIHIECSKQFKWNSYIYVSGQNCPIWR